MQLVDSNLNMYNLQYNSSVNSAVKNTGLLRSQNRIMLVPFAVGLSKIMNNDKAKVNKRATTVKIKIKRLKVLINSLYVSLCQ